MKSSRSEKLHYLAFPGASSWELWEYDEANAQKLVRSANGLAALNIGARTLVCLPSAEVCSCVLSLATTDEKMLESMAILQMEGRGLTGKAGNGAISAIKPLNSAEGHTLCLALSVPQAPQSVCEVENVSDCTASFEAIPFEDNAVTIWKELEVLNATITSHGKVVAIQRLSSKEIDQELISEILCLKIQLELEGAIQDLTSLVVWDGIKGADGSDLPRQLPFPVRSANRPQPVWPESPVNLLLPQHQARQMALKQRKRLAKGGLIAAGVVVAILCLFGLNIAWLAGERAWLEKGNTDLRPKVADIRSTALHWDALAPAMDPRQTALEIFYQIVLCMPSTDIDLTLFQLKDGQVIVEGEAKGPANVASFENRISKSEDLSAYAWAMPPPAIRANNVAHFEMTGQLR